MFLLLTTLLCLMPFGYGASAESSNKKNWVSDEIRVTPHALERMKERKIDPREVERVLRDGIRSWSVDNRTQFTERKNILNPLICILDRSVVPNELVTAYRDDLSESARSKRKYNRMWKTKANRQSIKDSKMVQGESR
jgi:F420-0:gamma-glutamyl ligase